MVLGLLISLHGCGALRIAAFGDYGWAGSAEAGVASMIAKWAVDDVLALGDCNYVSSSGVASVPEAAGSRCCRICKFFCGTF